MKSFTYLSAGPQGPTGERGPPGAAGLRGFQVIQYKIVIR